MNKFTEAIRDSLYNVHDNIDGVRKDHPRATKVGAIATGIALASTAFFATSDSSMAQWMRANTADMWHAAEDQLDQLMLEGAMDIADLACRAGLDKFCPLTGEELFGQMQDGVSVTDIPTQQLIHEKYQTIS